MKQASHEFHSTNRGRDVDVRTTSQGVATGQRERGEPTSSEARSRLAGDTQTAEDIRAVLSTPGRSLPTSLQAKMEERFGCSFAHVQLHTDTQAVAACQERDVRACTIGNHIVIDTSTVDLETDDGGRVIAHELTHVCQQKDMADSVQQWIQQGGPLQTVTDDRFEQQARRAETAMLNGGQVDVQPLQLPANGPVLQPMLPGSSGLSSTPDVTMDDLLRAYAAPDITDDPWLAQADREIAEEERRRNTTGSIFGGAAGQAEPAGPDGETATAQPLQLTTSGAYDDPMEIDSSGDSMSLDDMYPGSAGSADPETQTPFQREIAAVLDTEQPNPSVERYQALEQFFAETDLDIAEEEKLAQQIHQDILANDEDARQFADQHWVDENTAKWLLYQNEDEESRIVKSGFSTPPVEPFQSSARLQDLYNPDMYAERRDRLGGRRVDQHGNRTGITQQVGESDFPHAALEAPLAAAGQPTNLLSSVLGEMPSPEVMRAFRQEFGLDSVGAYSDRPVLGRHYIDRILLESAIENHTRNRYRREDPDVAGILLALEKKFNRILESKVDGRTNGQYSGVKKRKAAGRKQSRQRNIKHLNEVLQFHRKMISAPAGIIKPEDYDEPADVIAELYTDIERLSPEMRQWWDGVWEEQRTMQAAITNLESPVHELIDHDIISQELHSKFMRDVNSSIAEIYREKNEGRQPELRAGEAAARQLMRMPQKYTVSDKIRYNGGEQSAAAIKSWFKKTLAEFGGTAIMRCRTYNNHQVQRDEIKHEDNDRFFFINGITEYPAEEDRDGQVDEAEGNQLLEEGEYVNLRNPKAGIGDEGQISTLRRDESNNGYAAETFTTLRLDDLLMPYCTELIDENDNRYSINDQFKEYEIEPPAWLELRNIKMHDDLVRELTGAV